MKSRGCDQLRGLLLSFIWDPSVPLKRVVRSIINIKAAGRVHRAIHQPCVSSMLDEEATARKAPTEPHREIHSSQSADFSAPRPVMYSLPLRATNEDQTGCVCFSCQTNYSNAESMQLELQGEMCCSRSTRAYLHLYVGGIFLWWMYAHANMRLYYFVWVPRWLRRGYGV